MKWQLVSNSIHPNYELITRKRKCLTISYHKYVAGKSRFKCANDNHNFRVFLIERYNKIQTKLLTYIDIQCKLTTSYLGDYNQYNIQSKCNWNDNYKYKGLSSTQTGLLYPSAVFTHSFIHTDIRSPVFLQYPTNIDYNNHTKTFKYS